MRRDELAFRCGRRAAEHFVAMGKAPEAIDDFLVPMRVVEVFGEPELREQFDRARLHRAIFRVLKRHVEEQSLLRGQLLIESHRNRLLCDR